MNSLPLPDIDPVEIMLAAIGIRPIISRKVERIGADKLSDMAKIPQRIVRSARDLVHGDEIQTTFGNDNYRRVLEELAQGWDVDQVKEMLDQVPREFRTVASALVIRATDLIAQMNKEYPSSSWQTVAGQTKLTPSDTRMFRFISVLEVIDRPMVVFELMSSGALLQSQVEAMRMVYPTLSAAIDTAIYDSVVRARTAKKSFQLPTKAERGVKAWMGKGPIPLSMLARAQATAQNETVKENDRKVAAQDPTKADLTQAQKAEMA